MERKKLGKFGEDTAAEYLEREGYRIVQRNYRCRMGEIDIIALRGNKIVFCEVKTRTANICGMPAEAVGRTKVKHIRNAAMYYINTHDIGNNDPLFDVIEIYIHHIENAF